MNIIIEEIVSEFPVLITEEVVQIKISDATSYFDLIEVSDVDFEGKNGYIPTVNESTKKIELQPKDGSSFSGSYNDLTDVPQDIVHDSDYIHTDNNYTDSDKQKVQDIDNLISNVNTNSTTKITVKLSEGVNKGQAVYISEANGTNIIVSKASNNSESTSSKTLGLLETTGVTNAIVNVVTKGFLTGLNTNSATIGDAVWLGTNGNLIFGLSSKPVAPAHLVYIGVVSRVHTINGEILVSIQNGFEMNEIHDFSDVNYTTPIDTDSLMVKDVSTNLWKRLTFANLKVFLNNIYASKSLSAYSLRVNNTNAVANASEVTFKSVDPIDYTETPTFTFTGTQPTNLTEAKISFQQINKVVTISFNMYYTTQGNSVTQVVLPLPATFPVPYVMSTLDVNSGKIAVGKGLLSSDKTTVVGTYNICFLRKNSAGTGYEIVLMQATGNVRQIQFNLTYQTI